MKPTQQEIIELAREAGFEFDKATKYEPASLLNRAKHDIHAFQRFATLLLERFGAGGGEPDAYMAYNTKTGERCPFLADDPDLQHAKSFAHVKTQALYLHLSPTDLRAEYLRGLEDAKKIASNYGPSRPIVTKTPSQRIVGRWEGEQAASAGIADAIEALKGKQ